MSSVPQFANLFRSDRLTYRAISDNDADTEFLHSIQSDIEAFASSDAALLRPQTDKATRDFKEHVTSKILLGVIICLTPSEGQDTTNPEPIGLLQMTSPSSKQTHHRNSEIAIDIIRAHQGKGYGGEAINWALDWGFKQAGLHRVAIACFSFNEGAARLYERLGFVWEGRHRENYWFNGGWHDLVMFGMLEREWREIRKQGKGVNKYAT